MENKRHYIIKSIYLAKYLQQKGFELVKVKMNKFYPKHNVFLFENTEELHQAISEYHNTREELRALEQRLCHDIHG